MSLVFLHTIGHLEAFNHGKGSLRSVIFHREFSAPAVRGILFGLPHDINSSASRWMAKGYVTP